MATLPPLPKIAGDVDLLLDVYTHKSLRFGGAPLNDEYGDTERLAELGAQVLDLAVTFHFYARKPMLPASEIAQKRAQAISDQHIEQWLNAYGLRQKLRFAPSEKDSIGSAEEIRRFFFTYIGALHIRNGMPTIQQWISRLIDPDVEPVVMEPPPTPQSVGHPNWVAPPPSGPPPPLPAYVPNSPSRNGSLSSVVGLALVNQTAAQKGYVVTYPAEQVGPAHQPTWTVRCCRMSYG